MRPASPTDIYDANGHATGERLRLRKSIVNDQELFSGIGPDKHRRFIRRTRGGNLGVVEIESVEKAAPEITGEGDDD
jgi:hypothetical protein